MTFEPEDYLTIQVGKGVVGAFEILYKKYYRLAYNYTRQLIDDPSICQDIVQDIFAYVWESKSTLQINKSFKSYLLSACHNTCLNYIKKQGIRQRHIIQVLGETNNYHDGYDPIFEDELRTAIDKTLDELPAQCREIFMLSRVKGLKHKEIGKILNISPKTVETQIYRALKALKKQLPL